MKSVIFSALSLSLLVAANDPAYLRRQATTTPPGTPAPTTTVPPTATPQPPSATVSGTGTLSGNGTNATTTHTPPPTVPLTLISQNPTAIPLSQITANATSAPTIALRTAYQPGVTPTGIPGAPPLPDISGLNPANYPPLDRAPPTDSAEVQQWKAEVAASGVEIPNFDPTTDFASCAANPAAAADTSRCWWTCGGCVAENDVIDCPDKMTWGLTYDDGPAFYTPNLLQYLDEQNLKTTFFVVGSRCLQSPRTLQAEYMGGHQLGVHTWSHTPLTTQTNDQIIAELGWTKKIIKDVTGVTPNTFRPPYGDVDNRVRAIAAAMGLKPVIWTRASPTSTFDTGDFNIAGGTISVSQVISNFDQILGNATQINTGFIVLEHDLFQQSVEVATGYILPQALAHQPPFKLQPVVECLNLNLADAYIETNDNTTNPPIVPSSDSGSGSGSTSGRGNAAVTTKFVGRDTLLSAMMTGAGGVLAGLGLLVF